MRKRLNFPELRGEVPQFVPETLEHPTLQFSDDQIALIPKIGDKIEKKNCTLRLISHRSLHF